MRNIGLHTVLYFLTGSKVINSSEVELRTYIREIIRLSSSMVIYLESELNHSQSLVGTKPDDILEWRYIKHLSGEYHSIDLHIKPGLDADIGNMAISDLYEKYPGYEVLIDGLLSPIDMTDRFANNPPKNMEILGHDKYLIASNETRLLADLQEELYRYDTRWNVGAYSHADEAYALAYRVTLAYSMVTMILTIRDKYRNTNLAANFHIVSHLRSHGRLDRYYDFYSEKQRLWLYRNIKNLIKNSGIEETQEQILKIFFIEEGFDISDISFNRQDKEDGIRAGYVHKLTDLRDPEQSYLMDGRGFKDRTNDLTPYNIDTDFHDVDRKALLTLQDDQETKFMLLRVAVQAPITISAIAYKLSYWLHASHLGDYTEKVEFTYESKFGPREIKITPAVGYMLFMKLLCDLNEVTVGDAITERIAKNIQKESYVVDPLATLLDDRDVDLIQSSLIPKPIPMTVESFSYWTDKIITTTDGVNLRGNALGYTVSTLEYKGLVNSTTEDIAVPVDMNALIALDPVPNIKDNESRARLLSSLLKGFTGLDTTNAGELLVKAAYFIDLYKQLCSYDTDIILEGSINPPDHADKIVPTVTFVNNHVKLDYLACGYTERATRIEVIYPGVKLSARRPTIVRTRFDTASVSRAVSNITARVVSRNDPSCESGTIANLSARDYS